MLQNICKMVVRVLQATTQYWPPPPPPPVSSLAGVSLGQSVVVSMESSLTMDVKESMSDEDELAASAAEFCVFLFRTVGLGVVL